MTGRPRPFESRAHAEAALYEMRAAVLDGQPLDRVLDRMRGRTPAQDMPRFPPLHRARGAPEPAPLRSLPGSTLA